jgi:hypothetical protein
MRVNRCPLITILRGITAYEVVAVGEACASVMRVGEMA